jgi:hypothetical protein
MYSSVACSVIIVAQTLLPTPLYVVPCPTASAYVCGCCSALHGPWAHRKVSSEVIGQLCHLLAQCADLGILDGQQQGGILVAAIARLREHALFEGCRSHVANAAQLQTSTAAGYNQC